ncbi:MAG: peptidoglycan LD-endopeptidase LytH [Solirubrobacteraceae bacterium]|jgi:murein DD-endopeptidase MepM/ murein hydrolase activator NlpD|nr:peptidoglycan LD-endopeptidase LytH [Solirubrobacteraceae bacterium]
MSFSRALALLVLVLVPGVAAVAVASAPQRSGAPDPALLRARPVASEMRAFAAHRRAVERRRAGVSPLRGPVDYGTAINRFGVGRGGHTHGGQDVFAPTGTPLRAVHDGVVLDTGSDGGRGNYVEIYAPRVDRTFAYFHMNAPALVHRGQRVRAGRRVGAVGCSGSCEGAHLHFEIHLGRGAGGRGIDPLPALRRWLRAA